MFYTRLAEIKSKLQGCGVFDSSRVYLGDSFAIGSQNLPLCIIKSGSVDIDNRKAECTLHVICLFRNATNIEQEVHTNLSTILRELMEVEDIQPVYVTFDEDVTAPFGFALPQAPPFGAFRIDLQMMEAF